MRPKNTWPKFEKNTFPKKFFNEIWLKLEDYEYIAIAEIKFGYFISVRYLGKSFFPHPQKL